MQATKIICKATLLVLIAFVLFTSQSTFAKRRNTNATPNRKNVNSAKLNNSKAKADLKKKSAKSDDDEVDCPYSDCPDGEYCSEMTNGCCYKCAPYPEDKQPLPIRQAR